MKYEIDKKNCNYVLTAEAHNFPKGILLSEAESRCTINGEEVLLLWREHMVIVW